MRRPGSALAIAVVCGALAPACWCGGSPDPLYRIDVDVSLHPYAYDEMLRQMDDAGIARAVNLAGGPPGEILSTLVQLGELTHSRIVVVANVDWRDVDEADFGSRAARSLERAVALGARGLMVTRDLGLGVRTRDGRLLAVDDPRLDPLWAQAAALDVPVWLSTAAPAAYFEPIDDRNPRRAEIEAAPELCLADGRGPRREDLLIARDMVIARHPRTTFVCPALASTTDDLAAVDTLLELFGNVYVDTATALSDLGSYPPDVVRSFVLKHQRRLLFGSGLEANDKNARLGTPAQIAQDGEQIQRFYAAHWRYFETLDPDIANPIPIQSDSMRQGLGLPRSVLHAIYHGNAERLLKLAAVSTADFRSLPRASSTAR
ncbi:MAG: amidohydrolase family protein [Deltaproteobacteria bacterium]|nr:amidohydrolase family protein [Deltaproteobacteria bacterium]